MKILIALVINFRIPTTTRGLFEKTADKGRLDVMVDFVCVICILLEVFKRTLASFYLH